MQYSLLYLTAFGLAGSLCYFCSAMKGIVTRNTGSSYDVLMPSGETVTARIKGNFRIKGIRTTNPVAVGDEVVLSPAADDCHYITRIMPRRNYIIRRASNLSKESHILAANIDQTLLVVTVREPLSPTTFIDRFLATAEAYGVPASIVVNKEDIWTKDDREYAEALRNLYESIGYKVYFTSATIGEGLDALADELKNKTTLLAGNSGVGKSSLINALVPGADLKTGEISDMHHTGVHTTTFSEMLPLPQGGNIIDIPGIRGFGSIDFDKNSVSHYFPEIFRASERCRFNNCTHTHEPGCAVLEDVEKHLISQSRYTSYLSILEEVDNPDDKYRKPY